MKTYTFYAYFFNGSGKVLSLSDWLYSSDNYFLPHTRDLEDSDFVRFVLDNPVSGMYRVNVISLGLAQAFAILKHSLILNRLDLVLSSGYDCLSSGVLSRRKIRTSQYRFFDSV